MVLERKAVSGIMLTLMLMGMLTLAFNIQPVKASGTIYIRADGSIDPPTAQIFTADNVTYTFTGDINDSVVIERDNIVVDGVGYILQGTGSGAGIDITERSNVTIKNTQIETFEFGIRLWQSSNNTISLNNIKNNDYGILLGLSYNNTLSSNLMNSNIINFGVYGSELYHFFHSVDTSNLVNDKPIYYWVNRHGVDIPSDAGYVALVNCTEITIRNLTLTHNRQGLLLVNTQNSYITNNNLTNNGDGIFVYQSSNNIIYGNNIAANKYYGIYLEHFSNYNTISGNNITSNGCGIWLWFSSNNTISVNNIMAHDWEGIFIWSFSNCNTISGNTLISNLCGIWLADSLSMSIIYHNNFISNLEQVTISGSGYANRWDDGYPSGGNYWSDYVGVDVKSGSSQDLHGSDGIGDMPYIIDSNNVDHYPLMNPYGAPPPPTYTLTITTTTGGTTNPTPGTYSYTANSSVQVTAIPEANYLFDHWEFDTANVGSANPYTVPMDKDHTVKAVFTPIPPPLSVSINPLSASINVGQSVTFTSTVSGGYTPYTYQWYLNGAPVSGATSNTWTFTPTTSGIYYIHLTVTDAKDNTNQSETARITVAAVPVGGYSVPIKGQNTPNPLTLYLALIAILATVFTAIKRKIPNKK